MTPKRETLAATLRRYREALQQARIAGRALQDIRIGLHAEIARLEAAQRQKRTRKRRA